MMKLQPSFWQLGLFAFVYLLAAWSGKLLTLALPLGACLWPPSGIFAAVLLSSPSRSWVWYVAVAVVADITASLAIYGFSLPMTLVITIGNTLEAVVGAALVKNWLKGPVTLNGLKPMLALVALSGLIAPCVSAMFGAAALTIYEGQSYVTAWQLWWVGDAVGVLVIAPLALESIEWFRRRTLWPPFKIIQCVLMLVAVVGIGHFVFSGRYPFVYLTVPVLLWAALKFEVAGAAAAVLILTIVTTVYTAHNQGPFANQKYSDEQRQLLVQTFIMISAMMALTLGVLTRHWRESQSRLGDAVASAEAEAALRTGQVRDSELTFRAVFEHSGTGIALLNLDGEILRCNPAYGLMLGYGAPDLANINFLNLVIAEDQSKHRFHFSQLVQRVVNLAEIEIRYVKNSGESMWVREVLSLLPEQEGHESRILVLVDNIQARRQQQQTLIEADHNKNQFIAMLAHELRNPLAPICTGIAVLRHGQEGDQAVLDILTRQVGQLTSLIDDLLDVSRIGSGKIAVHLTQVLLADVVKLSIEASSPAIEAARHELMVNISGEPLRVAADVVRLTQVFTNLLNNAAKYTPSGGRIEVVVCREENVAVVRVRDNGLGIPSSMLEEIFVMFSQVNRTLDRSQGGLGIGLSLVRQLVHLHQGTVTAESPGLDGGSTFTVSLPLTE